MWKWTAAAALIYGMLAVWSVAGPRVPHARGIVPPPPVEPPPAAWDFEAEFPPPRTLPQSRTEVVVDPGGNHFLSWRFSLKDARLHTLALPLAPPTDPVDTLVLKLRAEPGVELHIGLREADGSILSLMRQIGGKRVEWRLPLGELRPAEAFPDENDRLDFREISALVLTHVELRPPRGSASEIVIELDDVRLE
jgi:hypothetical protein